MLQNFAYYAQIISPYIHKVQIWHFLSLILATYLIKSRVSSFFLVPWQYEISSIQLIIHLCVHNYMNTSNSFYCSYLQLWLIHSYLTKLLVHIHPNLTTLHKICTSYKCCWLLYQFLPIIPALCSMLLPLYYAQNYAGILGSAASL